MIDDQRTLSRQREEERLRAAEKERNALRRLYNAHRKREAEKLVQRFPAESEKLATLMRSIRRLGANEGARLVKMVEAAVWLRNTHKDLRYAALSMLSRSLILRREALLLQPFDDPLPPQLAAPGVQTDNAFSRIRSLLNIT